MRRHALAVCGLVVALLATGVFSAATPEPASLGKPNPSCERKVLITTIYYNVYAEGQQFVGICNPNNKTVDLSQWSLTNLDAECRFPNGTELKPFALIYISRNATAFLGCMGFLPDYEYSATRSDVAQMVSNCTLSFGKTSGKIALVDVRGVIVDIYVYGRAGYRGPGWEDAPSKTVTKGCLAQRKKISGRCLDTDTARDWDSEKSLRAGRSSFESEQFVFKGTVDAFVSPDSSFGAIAGEMDSARESIWINVYTFTSWHLAEHMIAAAKRGVETRLLLEGSPVGGVAGTELYIAERLSENGTEVRFVVHGQDDGVYSRYTHDHAKYMLVDNSSVMIASENFGTTGVPQANSTGNRGWGAIIRNRDVCGYYGRIFLSDRNSNFNDIKSSREYIAKSEITVTVPGTENFEKRFDARFNRTGFNGDFRITPVVAPDSLLTDSDPVLGMIANAEKSVLAEQNIVSMKWDKLGKDVYLESLIDAARRGCSVRLLLDSCQYDDATKNPNHIACDYVNGIARAEGIDILAKMINLNGHGFVKLHNKGLIIDGEKTLISSINWNYNSVAENREIGAIVENGNFAKFYSDVFSWDWSDDRVPPEAVISLSGSPETGRDILLDASLSKDDTGIVKYAWDLNGDGLFEEFSSGLTLVYDFPGNYTIRLVVWDGCGNRGEQVKTICIQSKRPENGSAESGKTGGGLGIAAYLVVPMLLVLAIGVIRKIKMKRKKTRRKKVAKQKVTLSSRR